MALVVFAVGALGAAALTAHAVRVAGRAERWEAALVRMESLRDSLARAMSAESGTGSGAGWRYEWTVDVGAGGRRIEVRALGGGMDTLVLRAQRSAAPPLLLP